MIPILETKWKVSWSIFFFYFQAAVFSCIIGILLNVWEDYEDDQNAKTMTTTSGISLEQIYPHRTRGDILAVVGGLFVVEARSVIIQVLYFKRTGKRVFLMAPIHHHYEKKGWAEPQIVIRFWIISLILAMIGLATLKVR